MYETRGENTREILLVRDGNENKDTYVRVKCKKIRRKKKERGLVEAMKKNQVQNLVSGKCQIFG